MPSHRHTTAFAQTCNQGGRGPAGKWRQVSAVACKVHTLGPSHVRGPSPWRRRRGEQQTIKDNKPPWAGSCQREGAEPLSSFLSIFLPPTHSLWDGNKRQTPGKRWRGSASPGLHDSCPLSPPPPPHDHLSAKTPPLPPIRWQGGHVTPRGCKTWTVTNAAEAQQSLGS